MAFGCFPGPNPVDDNDPEGIMRASIWKWIKKPYGVDPKTGKETGGGWNEGRSFEDISDSVNHRFYGGVGKPEWITDVMGGRKTPYKFQVTDAWAKQKAREVSVANAKRQTDEILKLQKRGALFGPLGKVINEYGPRAISTWEHAIPLASTHTGDLMYQPKNVDLQLRNVINTIRFAHPLIRGYEANKRANAAVAQKVNNMKIDDHYDMALRSKLKVGSETRLGDQGGPAGKIWKGNDRAWELMKTVRYNVWKRLYLKGIKPGMTEEEKLDIGKHVAELANHATGSGDGWIHRNLKGLLFGPSLTESKGNRIIGDPIKTVGTFAKMMTGGETTPGERYVAWKRLNRSTAYVGSLLSTVVINGAINKYLFHTKDEDNINLFNPTKADWMSYKMGDLEWSMPGLHTELKFLGNLVAMTTQAVHPTRQISKETHGLGQMGEAEKAFGQWIENKLIPGGQILGELAFHHDWKGRPLSFEPGTGPGDPKHPPVSLPEYAIAHGPIPLSGPIGYIYDQLAHNGVSAGNITMWIKALEQFGGETLGMRAKTIDPNAPKPKAHH
jgi:hypothetical protein